MLNDPAHYSPAPGLSCRVTTPAHVLLEMESRCVFLDCDVFSVLDAFKRPSTMLEASNHFEKVCCDSQHFSKLLELSLRLSREGFLCSESAIPSLVAAGRGFSSTTEHARMLNDTSRTRLMMQAVEAVVKPGDVVVDIGSGTGILSMAAARAGARRVFALEQGAMASVAETLVGANGFADRIEIIRSWSWDAELPERADVVIGEILGNDPLVEGILLAYQDAAIRLAKPEARFVPSEVRLFVYPVNVPPAVRNNWSFVPASMLDWQKNFGFDFSALGDCLPSQGEYRLAAPDTIGLLRPVGAPRDLATFHPHMPHPATAAKTVVRVEEGETMNAVLLAWEAQLAPGIVIQARPPLELDCNWQLVVWLLPTGQEIQGPATVEVDWNFYDTSSFRVHAIAEDADANLRKLADERDPALLV